MKKENARRLVRTFSHQVEAPAAKIFPLLCPVLEYDWIPLWKCDMVYSDTGVAENNCIFKTDFPNEGEVTWVVSRYEPNRAIEFVMFMPESHVKRLDIYLVESPKGTTTLTWTRTITATSAKGESYIEHFTDEVFRVEMNYLDETLRHYLRTGKMLVSDLRWD